MSFGLALTLLYALTLCPSVYWYDSAEFAAKAASLGVPHPPGYPLYTVIAHMFTWLPGEAALGVNLMSLTFGVGTAVMLLMFARDLGASWPGALCSAAMLGTMPSYWGNAVVAEVYTPGLLFTLLVFVLLRRAHNRTEQGRDGGPRLLLWAGLVGGLGVGMHMSIATCGLGYVWLVAGYGPNAWKPRLLQMFKVGAAAVAGLSVFIYVPLRTFRNWDATDWTHFRKNATGGTFKRKFLRDYDLGDRAELVGDVFVENLQWVGLALALVGLVVLLRRQRFWAVGIGLGVLGNVYWFFNYRVPDLDVFFLPALMLLCLCVGFGVDATVHPVATRMPKLGVVAWLGLVVPAVAVATNYQDLDLSSATQAKAFGSKLCAQLPANSNIVMFSSPPEWRVYSVFIYFQRALDQCEGVGLQRKPKLSEVVGALRRGQQVFAFVEIKHFRHQVQFVPFAGIYRVQLKSRVQPAVQTRQARQTR